MNRRGFFGLLGAVIAAKPAPTLVAQAPDVAFAPADVLLSQDRLKTLMLKPFETPITSSIPQSL